jgi:hypothetical protein
MKCPLVIEPKSLGYCNELKPYRLPNKAPKGPLEAVPGMVTPPIVEGIEIMAIENLFL